MKKLSTKSIHFSLKAQCELQNSEIQKVLEEPQLKLQRATETRRLSHQMAVDALRRTLVSVHSLLEQEAIDGEALAYGLFKEIEKPAFVANILFLSNVLSILGNLSKTFQLAHLNLLTVNKLINAAISQLDVIKDDVLHTGYMAHLEETMQSINCTSSLDEEIFVNNATSYLNALITNFKNRFPQGHILTLLGYFQPGNVNSATPLTLLDLGDFLQIDGQKLWLEFAGYKSFIESLPEPRSLLSTIHAMYRKENQAIFQTTHVQK